MQGDQPIFLYDGVCLLCDGAVQFTLAREKTPSIVFVAIQSETGRGWAKNMARTRIIQRVSFSLKTVLRMSNLMGRLH